MTWNWQRPEWPDFSWRRERLVAAEEQFLVGGGVFIGSVGHLGGAGNDELTVESLSIEAMTTSAIEGEILDRTSVQSSIRRHLGLDIGGTPARLAEDGIAGLMVDLYHSFAAPLSDETMFAWHGMLTSGRRDLQDIGRYRRHAEPMQIVSAADPISKVHFEAPPSERVPAEMARLIYWFNLTAPGGAEPLPALTRAGIVHLWFECIHPFEDGNGRIGRAVAEKALAQSLGRPVVTALAATILGRRREYYDALECNSTETEITDWLAWFAAVTIEAQKQTIVLVEFLIAKTRLLDRLRGQMNERQEKALLRILREGPEGFKGGLSASNYISITGAATATASRDLADMVAQDAFIRTGTTRHARYRANIPARPVARISIDARGRIVDTAADA